MTPVESTPGGAGTVSALEHTEHGVSVDRTSTAGVDSAAPATGLGRHRRRDGRRRTAGGASTGSRQILQDRRARLRLLSGSLIGAGCLILAYRFNIGDGSPFAPPFTAPSAAGGWITLIAGIVGAWLVPGLCFSTVMMRTGSGPVARLATRIGATLAWYALVGPVVHVSAEGALVTDGGLVGVTLATTAALCLGVALGLLRHPANPRLRALIAALAGGLCAQGVIWLSMLVFTHTNYQHIRRLDWLIVLFCALLTAIGAHSRPYLPMVRMARHIRTILISLAVVVFTGVALFFTGTTWSPAQREPSAIAAEQIAALPGADVAFSVTAIGPEGAELIKRAVFTASDETGRPVPVGTRLADGGASRTATLLLLLDSASRPQVCGPTADGSEQDAPVKLTVRDENSGLRVQAVIPAEWCAL
jgi:hypothetical protein